MKAKAMPKPVGDELGDTIELTLPWADKAGFTRFKFAWLRQVAADSNLPPAAAPIAILIADEYLNDQTGDCWPSVDTLARQLGRGKTQTRAALQAMDGLHLAINWSAGGKGQTNRYRPVLFRKPSGNPEGNDSVTSVTNPSENRSQTLRNSALKPSGNPETNPYEGIPLKEPRAGRPKAAPAHVSRSRSTSVPGDDSGASASRAPVVYHPDGFNVGVEVEVVGEGVVVINERVGELMTAVSLTGESITFRRVQGFMNVVSRRRERFKA
ncbi:helix-turn-helix domain-containing protein [Mesorhizobium sp. M4B.F.Ca.ET.013.02.1.1]|uniref:helix-turn-helix domain-containing protein n=1 Tax=Mesorhizobium sp. M4B.F.Ca.ET.013.02.1.1 TaxID=2496755 RepID=UPI000FD2761D|nr:helix-turn-helix domain-containing protein [Mesorhizobium sp. M4B.F.Ca.ET.013.02.1.1]RUW24623.1 hypothetical protein EOA34_14340 [Mesorhizobium sp. M4B.F.Ca.ET.013.02.1.1]